MYLYRHVILFPLWDSVIVLLCVVYSSFAVILMGKRELVALLGLSRSSQCLIIVVLLFLTVLCLQFVIVVFTDHTHLIFS